MLWVLFRQSSITSLVGMPATAPRRVSLLLTQHEGIPPATKVSKHWKPMQCRVVSCHLASQMISVPPCLLSPITLEGLQFVCSALPVSLYSFPILTALLPLDDPSFLKTLSPLSPPSILWHFLSSCCPFPTVTSATLKIQRGATQGLKETTLPVSLYQGKNQIFSGTR